jgi:hypothetical protein
MEARKEASNNWYNYDDTDEIKLSNKGEQLLLYSNSFQSLLPEI